VFHDLGVEGPLQDFYVASQAGHLDHRREHLADLIVGKAVTCDGEPNQLMRQHFLKRIGTEFLDCSVIALHGILL
jgi:hypothetical protein